ncbi:pyrimidine 5'-nucleotidase [Hirschia litorea]|uniref:Pyrimidine 5'-nucleotidase n=1 Tax=Hirschia litorea TaxID=1199156 RepID=A0ABW2IK86_9PROT
MTTPQTPSLSVDFANVQNWVFDLDNTLYPAACDLFAEIDQRMTAFVMRQLDLPHDEARAIQKDYYARYGTTLRGMMIEHGLDPTTFMNYVHDIDHSPLDAAPDIKAQLSALPGKKYIYTNGSTCHAEKVSRYMGIDHLFDDMICIAKSNFLPKHEDGAFDRFIELTGVDPKKSAMFEDLSRNLIPAHQLGFKTVLVTSLKDWSHEPEGVRPAHADDAKPVHVHHTTNDLPQFLIDIVANIAPKAEAS